MYLPIEKPVSPVYFIQYSELSRFNCPKTRNVLLQLPIRRIENVINTTTLSRVSKF
jgi:hypothetical protein